MTNSAAGSGSPDDQRDRVRYLLAHFWRGNQREMARSIAVSQGLVSKVVNGVQGPGHKFLRALAAHPGINAEWVWAGTGEPIVRPDEGSLPIAFGLLPGPPGEHGSWLSGQRHPVASSFQRPTRYWLVLAPNSVLVSDPRLRFLPGDLLLLEADPAWTRRPDLTEGRLCGVHFPERPEPEYHLCRVRATADGPVAQMFGGTVVWPAPAPAPVTDPTSVPDTDPPDRSQRRRRTVLNLEREERRAAELNRERDALRQSARDGLPIRQDRIVAVQVYMVRPESNA